MAWADTETCIRYLGHSAAARTPVRVDAGASARQPQFRNLQPDES